MSAYPQLNGWHPAHASERVPRLIRAAPEREPVVRFEDVRKTFGKHDALHGITFPVPPGKIVGVIGPSGSGKTTTIRLMLGTLKPSHGTIRLFGRDPWRLRRLDRERIGYLPQGFVLYPTLTTEENLRFAASLYGVPWWKTGSRITRLLDDLDLLDARRRQAKDLSGGMRRRLSLAATLIHDPDFLVLDEPTAGIDPILRASIWNGFRQMRDAGKTMVITTQYVTEAEYCDQVLLINDGRVIAAGTPAELRRTATGGELLDVHFDRPRPHVVERLQSLPFVHHVEPIDRSDDVRVVVDDVVQGPLLLRAYCEVDEAGFVAIEPHTLLFDEVFVRLVKQAHNGDQEEMNGDARASQPTSLAA